MAELPDTRDSLLLRVRDPADAVAWGEFATIYYPVVYRLARRQGLQDADAEDLAQRVFLAVSQAVGEWEKDASRGNFRAWLLRIARNAIVNALTRGKPDVGAGGTSMVELLNQRPATGADVDSQLDDEYRRSVFRWAADQVRCEFHDDTWQAFWLTTIENLTIDDAAARLGKSAGSVYAARSRVMKRLKTKVRELVNSDH